MMLPWRKWANGGSLHARANMRIWYSRRKPGGASRTGLDPVDGTRIRWVAINDSQRGWISWRFLGRWMRLYSSCSKVSETSASVLPGLTPLYHYRPQLLANLLLSTQGMPFIHLKTKGQTGRDTEWFIDMMPWFEAWHQAFLCFFLLHPEHINWFSISVIALTFYYCVNDHSWHSFINLRLWLSIIVSCFSSYNLN